MSSQAVFETNRAEALIAQRHVHEEVIGSLTYQVSLEMSLETAHGLTDGAG